MNSNKMDDENRNEEETEQNATPEEQQTPTEESSDTPPPLPVEGNKKHLGKGLIFLAILLVVIVILGMRGDIPESLKFWSNNKSTVTKDVKAKNNIPSKSGVPSLPTLDQESNGHSNASTEMNKERVQEIIKEYLTTNPEIVMDALRSLEHKMAQQKTQDSKEFIDQNMDKLTANKPFLGNKNGNKLVIKFFDYKCGYCKSSHFTLERIMKEDKDVKVVLAIIPILGNTSVLAAKASIAMWKLSPQNFAKFHDDLLNTSEINEKTIETLAKKYNISKAKLSQEMNFPEIQQEINENMKMAHQLGVQGVPALVVNGEFMSGSMNYDALKKKLGENKNK